MITIVKIENGYLISTLSGRQYVSGPAHRQLSIALKKALMELNKRPEAKKESLKIANLTQPE
jgi:hypothetical protein